MALEPDLYDCDRCLVRARVDELDADNRDAWNAFHRICTRLTVDLHFAGHVFERIVADMDADDALDLLERCAVIYDVLNPAKRGKDRP